MNTNNTQPSESKKTTRQPMAIPRGMDAIHIETYHESRTTTQIYRDMKKARDYLRDKARHGFQVFGIYYRVTDVWGRPDRVAYITLAKDLGLGRCTVDWTTLRSVHRETVTVSATPGHQWTTFCYHCIDVHQVRNVCRGLSHWGSRRRTPSDEARIIAMVQAIPETEPITLAEDNDRCGVRWETSEVFQTDDGRVWAVNARGSLAYRVLNVENGQITETGQLDDAEGIRKHARATIWRHQPEPVQEPETSEEPETVQDLQPEFKQELLGVLSKFMSLSIDLDNDADNDNLITLATLRGLFALATNSTLADALDVTRETMNNPPDWAIKRTQPTADPSDVPAEDVPAGVSMSLDGGPVEVVAIWEAVDGSRWAEVRRNNVGPSEWWRLIRIQHVGGDKRAWRAWTTCDFRRAMVGRVVWGVA